MTQPGRNPTAIVACDIDWSDIGCWQALGDLTTPDSNINRIQGNAVVRDSKDNIKSESRVVGTVGAENLIIIDTPNALLFVDRNCVQEAKHIYSELKA